MKSESAATSFPYLNTGSILQAIQQKRVNQRFDFKIFSWQNAISVDDTVS